MDELKNMRNFNEFKDESLNEKLFVREFGHLNEEALWDAIKNLFSKIFGKIDKSLADAVANFTKKLDGSKSWEESVKYFNEALTVESQNMEKSLDTITGAWGLRKVVGDNASIIFIQWLEMKNKYGVDACAPKIIFQNNPMFQFDKSDDFNKNILNASNAVLFEVNKGISPPPFEEAALKTYLDKSPKDINQVQAAPTGNTTDQAKPVEQPKVQTPTAQGAPPATTPAQGGTPAAQNANYSFTGNRLFEEADAASQQNNQQPANPPASQQNNQQPAKPPAPQQNNQQQPNQQNNQQKSPIDILKEATALWIKTNFYEYSSKKIKEIKAPAKIGTEDAMLALAKGSKATTLHQNLAKMLRYIINVQDKQTLIKIRAALASDANLQKTENDLKNEIPL